MPVLFADAWWRNGVGVRWAVVFVVLGVTALQRFGLTVGAASLHIAVIAVYGLIALGLLSGRLAVVRSRLVLALLLMVVAAISHVVNDSAAHPGKGSTFSLVLLAVMYLPFIFVLKPDARGMPDADWFLRVFADVALVCAWAGILQFAAQFFIKADWLFNFSPYLPPVMRSNDGYNVVIAVGERVKSNGFFFKEPSLFSIVLALGILLELSRGRRLWRLAALGLALMLTYSGSGLLVLAVGLLFPLRLRTFVRLGGAAVVGGVAVLALWDVLNLGFTLGRVSEFTDPRSSAYQRYVAPMRLVVDSIGSSAWTPWIGHGPGTITRLGDATLYMFHDPTWAKALFEYGLLGFGLVLALAVVTLRHEGVPIQVRAGAFFCWLLTGGFLLTPEALFLMLVLAGLIPRSAGFAVDPPASAERPMDAAVAGLNTLGSVR
jgi:hypothetical protein